MTIEPHAVSRQGIDQGGRLGPELLGLEADAAIAVVTAGRQKPARFPRPRSVAWKERR